ncbi:hypothetical protein L2D14_17115 [Thalassospiraceae bacterium LMO-JJ14]|nr:hypothetical protein L2D14_17115 [Thalassospiraceae bacterium LMO-JJ14]
MNESENQTPGPDGEDTEGQRIPAMQSILDNPFLLLFIGVAVPAVFYTIWGIMEIAAIPVAN